MLIISLNFVKQEHADIRKNTLSFLCEEIHYFQ